MGMKRSNATNSPETKAASVLHSLASLSPSLSLSLSLSPPSFPLRAIFRSFSVANQSTESKPIKEQDVKGHVFHT